MDRVNAVVDAVDRWQRRHPPVAVAVAVLKKFGVDRANLYVVALGWYGFVAIFPLLLVVVTVLGFLGAATLGHQVVSTLHQFPIVGSEFNPQSSRSLHGSIPGLVVGLVGLVYGAQGVTQTAIQAMAEVWGLGDAERPGFAARLARSLLGLAIIGATFLGNAAVATYTTAGHLPAAVRALVIAAMAVMNVALFAVSFRVLTPKVVGTRPLLPGASLAAVAFTLLITVGSGLMVHQIRHSSATYGQFGTVLGLVGFLLVLAKLTLYSVELNTVLSRRLWPRALRGGREGGPAAVHPAEAPAPVG